jgi:protein TonB
MTDLGRRRALLLVALCLATGFANAQGTVERAKTLYLEASYDEALTELSGPEAERSADAQLYRALCLIALGRWVEADAAIARSIALDPQATRARTDVSPRVAALIAEARRRLLPDAARAAVTAGRAAMQASDRSAAEGHFDRAVRLLSDPVLADQPDLRDLRVVADGFLDLVRAQAAAARLPTASEPPNAARPPDGPPMEARPRAASAEPTRPPEARASTVVTPPRPISHAVPNWRSIDASLNRVERRGAVRVRVDASGRVSDARIEESVAPGFDRILLDAVRRWRYEPATRDGVPTEAELIVPIVLPPRGP